MKSINHSRRVTVAAATVASCMVMFLSTTIAFSPAPSAIQPHHGSHTSFARTTVAFSPAPSIMQPQHAPVRPTMTTRTTTRTSTSIHMSFSDVSNFYAEFPLQAAVLTCGVKASVADGIAQVRSRSGWDDIEARRNLAYVLYGGIFVGALCHYEYDVIFPLVFGTEHSLQVSVGEVLFDNFVSGPLVWLPPAYLIKAVVYDYSLREGLKKYKDDVTKNGLLQKYWAVWLPAQSISFTVVPDHLRVAFMASVSFFWFILFSTVSSSGESDASEA